MKKVLFLINFCSLVVGSNVISQVPTQGVELSKMIPASPNSAALGKYGDVPVSNYTGVPNISIPIFDIHIGKLSMPINLSYHAGGLKVEELGSSIGLGWTLNAGGVITRSVRGLADDIVLYEGWLEGTKSVTRALSDTASQGYKDLVGDAIARRMIDGEPDIYYFNFGGYSGKFVMDQSGHCFTIPLQKIRIVAAKDGDEKIEKWTVTTPDGSIYTFGANEDETAQEIVETTNSCGGVGETSKSAWYLVAAKDVFGNKISFTYDDENYTTTTRAIESKYTFYNSTTFTNVDLNPPSATNCYNVNHYTYAPILKEITYSGGSIVLHNSTERPDLADSHSTDTIDIYSSVSGLLKRFIMVRNSGTMVLKKVIEKGFTTGSYVVADKEHSFEYYTTYNQPGATSYAEDYWGYYNGQTGNTTSIPASTYTAYGQSTETTLTGADRKPYANYAMAGTLTKITYPTGGSTSFEYETNTYHQVSPVNRNMLCGGIRIKKITDVDSVNNAVKKVKVFKYIAEGSDTLSSGALVSPPNFQYIIGEQRSYDFGGHAPNIYIVEFVAQVSAGNYPLAFTQGAPCGYSKVSVLEGESGENGKTDYYYINPELQNDELNRDFPFPPDCSYEWKRGALLKEVVSKNSGGTFIKVKKTTNTYSEVDSKYVIGIKAGNNPTTPFGSAYAIANGWVISENFNTATDFSYQNSSETIVYDQNDTSVFSTTKTYTDIDTSSFLPSKTWTWDSKGNRITTYIKYAGNFSDGVQLCSGGSHQSFWAFNTVQIGKFLGANKLAEVERVITKSDSSGSCPKLLYTRINLYKDYSPESVYLLQLDEPMVPDSFHAAFVGGDCVTASDTLKVNREIQYTLYDSSGNLLEQRKANNIYQSYIWDYNREYPIAEAINAKYSDIGYTSFEGNGTGNFAFLSGTIQTDGTAPTGGKIYDGGSVQMTISSAKTYIVSLWGKEEVPNLNHNSPTRTGKTVNGWTYYEFEISGASTADVGSDGKIDEVRIYPKEAHMQTYTYRPHIGMTSQSDVNGITTYYEYDLWGRLVRVLDQDKKTIKILEYGYKATTDK